MGHQQQQLPQHHQRYDTSLSPPGSRVSPRRYVYGSHSRGASPARAGAGLGVYGLSEEERSMERLASTFRSDDYTSGYRSAVFFY